MFTTLGSLTRNMRRAITLAALFACSSEVSAVESVYSMRIHRGFLKRIADVNFSELLAHMEDKFVTELPTDKVNGDLRDMRMRIAPRGGQAWDAVETDLFFDQGQIVMEVGNLEYRGTATVSDPRTRSEGTLHMHAPLEFCQIVLSLDQEVNDAGMLLPKVTVHDVALQLHKSDFKVGVDGNMPVYKTSTFENAIKDWIKKSIKAREGDFKQALQKAEREVIKSFKLEQHLEFSKSASSTLAEQMGLKGDHLQLTWNTHYEGNDLKKISKAMRSIQPKFSEVDIFQKDVQVAIDENYANYQLFSLFHNDKHFSVTELMLDAVPDTFMGAGAAIKAVMNTSLFGLIFPELTKEYGSGKRLDLRCGLNKDYLAKGGLDDNSVSQVLLHDGDRIEANLKFGCAVYVFAGESRSNPMEALMDLFQQVNTDVNDMDWEQYRSFFVSAKVDTQFEFGAHVKSLKHPGDHIIQIEDMQIPTNSFAVTGRIVDIKPTIHELKVFKGREELQDEAAEVQRKIDNLYNSRETLRENPIIATAMDMYFGNSMPLMPFPFVEPCLGMNSRDSDISIKEGYVQIAYDYTVEDANKHCLFDMADAKRYVREEKQYRMGLEAQKRSGGRLGSQDEALLGRLKKKAPTFKVYGEKIDISQGWQGLVTPLSNIATNPKVLVDIMQTAENTRQGIDQARKVLEEKNGVKGVVDDFFKNIMQN